MPTTSVRRSAGPGESIVFRRAAVPGPRDQAPTESFCRGTAQPKPQETTRSGAQRGLEAQIAAVEIALRTGRQHAEGTRLEHLGGRLGDRRHLQVGIA